MLFNSYIFILFFLPMCLAGYYMLNHRHCYTLGQIFLLSMSLWFYAYFNVSYFFIILGSIAVNYGIYIFFGKLSSEKARKMVLIAGLLVNIGVLLYFKYMDFFIRNINMIFHKEYSLLGILLPLGISFFTFQQVSFLVDAYKDEVPHYNFLYYASFVTFFPQLVAGPIVTHDELIPQFMDRRRKHIDWDYMSKGIYIFVFGLAKKVLLADTFGNAVNWAYDNMESLNSTSALVIMLAYTVQIYFDFSGYCDMAIGIGKMFHIDLPLNFHSPYQARTITEFWDRWHMTLTRFFTKYVYIPLGGSHKGQYKTYLNVMVVFLASGFWHGASWTFLFWGMCHGVFMVIARQFKGVFAKIPNILNWFITFVFVNVMWVFFRADSMGSACRFLSRIMICEFGRINENIIDCFHLAETNFFLRAAQRTLSPDSPLMLFVFLVLSLWIILGSRNAYERMERFRPSFFSMMTFAVLLVWCVFSFSGVSSFLYFNF